MSYKVATLLLVALLVVSIVAIYEGKIAMETISLVGTLRQQNEGLKREVLQLNSSLSIYVKTIDSLRALIRQLNGTLLTYKTQVDLLNQEIYRLRQNVTLFQERTASLLAELERANAEKEALKKELDSLKARYRSLLQEYERIQSEASALSERMKEVLYYRMFRVYNYKDNSTWYLYYRIPAQDYLRYRSDVEFHQPMTLENRLTPEILANASSTYDDPIIQEMANDLLQISNGDQELLVNMALQIVHQLYYNETLYVKYPVETLVESSGDCDNLAVLLASVLRAADMEVVLVIGTAKGVGHVMVGVALNEEPDDLTQYGRYHIWYVSHEEKKFYLAEPTWPSMGSLNYVDPVSEKALFVNGALVGDNPWGNDFAVTEIVYIP